MFHDMSLIALEDVVSPESKMLGNRRLQAMDEVSLRIQWSKFDHVKLHHLSHSNFQELEAIQRSQNLHGGCSSARNDLRIANLLDKRLHASTWNRRAPDLAPKHVFATPITQPLAAFVVLLGSGNMHDSKPYKLHF